MVKRRSWRAQESHQAASWDGGQKREVVMNLTEQHPSRLDRHLLGFPRSLLYRTSADPRPVLLRLMTDKEVYHKSTRATSEGQPNRRSGAFALPSPPDFSRQAGAARCRRRSGNGYNAPVARMAAGPDVRSWIMEVRSS